MEPGEDGAIDPSEQIAVVLASFRRSAEAEGIEPTRRLVAGAPVLKTGRDTSPHSPPAEAYLLRHFPVLTPGSTRGSHPGV